MRVFVCEAVYDRMVEIGLDDESETFEDILNAVVEHVCAHRVYGIDDKTPLERGVSRKGYKIKKRYPDGECREPLPNQQEIFMDWKMGVNAQLGGDWKLWELLAVLVATARKAKEDWYYEDGVSAGEGVGAGSDAADRSEPASDEDVSGDGAAGVGCAESETGTVEAELLDHGIEDEEAEADWDTRAAAYRFDAAFWNDVGVPREEPGEASDETGGVEGRKTCFGSLPPMSEYRTSLYAKGVCR